MQKQTGSGLHHMEREKSSKCFFCIKDDSVSIFPPPCASLKGTCLKQIPQPSRAPQGTRQGAGDKRHVPRTVPWHMPTAALLAPRLRARAGGGSQGPGRGAFVSPSKCAEPLGSHGVRRKQHGPGRGTNLASAVRQVWPLLYPFLTSAKMCSFLIVMMMMTVEKIINTCHMPPGFSLCSQDSFSILKAALFGNSSCLVSEVNKARLREIQKTCPWSHS